MQRCNFQIHANLPVSVPAPTSDRVCPPLARSALASSRTSPEWQVFFPVVAIQLSVRFAIGNRAKARCISFLAAARSAVPICRPSHQYRGQNKSRFRLEAAHLVQKTKCADLNMKSAAVGRFFAHCNRKSLAAANTRSRFSASNTVLLTCVIGNPPAPTSYLLTGHPCNGELSFRRSKPLRRDLTRTAPFRVGLATCFCLPILPESVRNRRVLRYLNIQFYRRKSSVGTYGREGAPLHDDLLYSVHYDIRFFAVWQANSCYSPVVFTILLLLNKSQTEHGALSPVFVELRITVRCISLCKTVRPCHAGESRRAGNNNAVRAAAAMDDQEIAVRVLTADDANMYVCRVKYEVARLCVVP